MTPRKSALIRTAHRRWLRSAHRALASFGARALASFGACTSFALYSLGALARFFSGLSRNGRGASPHLLYYRVKMAWSPCASGVARRSLEVRARASWNLGELGSRARSRWKAETRMKLRKLLIAIALLAVCLASVDGAGRAYHSVGESGDSGSDLLVGMLVASPFGLLATVSLVFALRLVLVRRPIDRSHWVPSRYSARFEEQRQRGR